MREIKFRGRRIDTGEWAYGNFCKNVFSADMIQEMDGERVSAYEVIPETVGQFIGQFDKNGTHIFEGDIIKGFSRHLNEWQNKEVIWDNNGWSLSPTIGITLNSEIEVIGNIHQHPHLLQSKTIK